MKFKLALLVSFIFSSTLYAQQHATLHVQQDTTLVKKQREIGLNATNFINSFISFNDQSGAPGNYLFSYRIYSEQGNIFRFGFDLDLNRLKTTDENTPDEESNRVSRLALRAGSEKQIHLPKRWTLFLGYDIIGGISRNRLESTVLLIDPFTGDPGILQDITRKIDTWNLGTGPCIGIQFNISDRIGVFTESTFYLNYSTSTEKLESMSTSFPVPEVDKKTNTLGFNIGLPTAIFFFVKI